MLTEDHEPKLCDFGMGRPPAFLYMAPELFCKQPSGTPGDIYSLGLILYFIATGFAPFEGFTSAEAAAKSAKLNIRPTLPQSLASNWKTLISSCWQKNALARPTAEQVLTSLQQMENGPDLSQDSDSEGNSSEYPPVSIISPPEEKEEDFPVQRRSEDQDRDQKEFFSENLPTKIQNSGGG
eukprot:CAMPEP_0117033584 /NCGR_PEP_ID=MMETSP0472-20121206/23978_1 /TAXON_ID=693140 ORGANISM="Tiarina fusus, Strain LIS" /NCGR_SAMPLE_ID=MMETSP0472 /ASSEMBLY_ACC=CAM_ASM_000603 /LENGTH=180 /DNA_ID=CAMNT_0004742527 /DNA_START=102 /DNA_END=640 /DNA_ORIENTATION=+